MFACAARATRSEMAMVNTALTDTVTLKEDPAGWLGGGDNVNKSDISCIWKHSHSCTEMTQAPFIL